MTSRSPCPQVRPSQTSGVPNSAHRHGSTPDRTDSTPPTSPHTARQRALAITYCSRRHETQTIGISTHSFHTAKVRLQKLIHRRKGPLLGTSPCLTSSTTLRLRQASMHLLLRFMSQLDSQDENALSRRTPSQQCYLPPPPCPDELVTTHPHSRSPQDGHTRSWKPPYAFTSPTQNLRPP